MNAFLSFYFLLIFKLNLVYFLKMPANVISACIFHFELLSTDVAFNKLGSIDCKFMSIVPDHAPTSTIGRNRTTPKLLFLSILKISILQIPIQTISVSCIRLKHSNTQILPTRIYYNFSHFYKHNES